MKHHDRNRKFSRERKVRRAFLTSLVTNLILKEKIQTTEARAKEIRPLLERLVTKGKQGTLASRRLVLARLDNHSKATKKLFETIAPRYEKRGGGYTRITRTGIRGRNDGRTYAVIEFV